MHIDNSKKIPDDLSIDNYLSIYFPRASKWEIEKLKNDWGNKEKSAEFLVTDFEKRTGPVCGKKVLEVGFGNGMQLIAFAKRGAIVSGLEVSSFLMGLAIDNLKAKDVEGDLQYYENKMPYSDNSFDYVYCTSVIEHVDNPARTLLEISRVLKKGGKLYLSFPNRLWPRETHTGVYFLNYMSKRIADIILRVCKKSSMDDWSLHFLSFWDIKRILKNNNIQLKITFETNADNYKKMLLKKILARFGIHHSAILRTVMLILEK